MLLRPEHKRGGCPRGALLLEVSSDWHGLSRGLGRAGSGCVWGGAGLMRQAVG